MVSLFKDRSPATIIWLILLSIIVHSHFIVYTPTILMTEADGLLSVFLKKYTILFTPALIVFTYHTIIILQSLRLNHLFTDHRMYSRANYFPAMTYILLTGLFTQWSSITPALISNTFIIWIFAEIVRLYNSPKPKTLLYNIGLLVGIATILYHPLSLLLLATLFALMILRPFLLTEWLVLILGVISPFYFLVCYLFLKDKFLLIVNFIPVLQLNIPHIQISVVFFITIAIIIFSLFIGLYYWQQENRRLLIQVRNNWIVLLVMLFITLPMPFTAYNFEIESLILCIVPASPIIAKGFLAPKKNLLPSLMFWALIIIGILKNWLLIK